MRCAARQGSGGSREARSVAADIEKRRGPGGALRAVRAFRPFFLGLAIYAVLAVPWWSLTWLGHLPAPTWLVPMWWHAHEMMFGFVAAAIAGFLLTASPVWSGGPAVTGRPLAALVTVWVAGRVAFAGAGWLPTWLLAAVDLAFLPAVAVAVVRTLWGSGQKPTRDQGEQRRR